MNVVGLLPIIIRIIGDETINSFFLLVFPLKLFRHGTAFYLQTVINRILHSGILGGFSDHHFSTAISDETIYSFFLSQKLVRHGIALWVH